MLYAAGALSLSKIHEILQGLTENGLPMSCGICHNVIRKMSEAAQPTIAELLLKLGESPVVDTDTTNICVNGETAYARNFSTDDTEVLAAMDNKSIEALEAIGFLVTHTGTLAHDHETARYHFGGSHSECNVHLDRYHKGIIELAESQWASACERCSMSSRMPQRTTAER